jgi:hypothetical protein
MPVTPRVTPTNFFQRSAMGRRSPMRRISYSTRDIAVIARAAFMTSTPRAWGESLET